MPKIPEESGKNAESGTEVVTREQGSGFRAQQTKTLEGAM
jgi:hypothetical protein